MIVRFHSKSTANAALLQLPTLPAVDDHVVVARTTALQRRLASATAGADEQHVIAAFLDAVREHEGIDGRAYAQTVRGDYEPAIGAASGPQPPALWLDNPPTGSSLFRLTRSDTDCLGWDDADEAMAACVGERALRSWLLVFAGDVPAQDETRFALYLELLDQALNAVSRETEAALRRQILERLLTGGGDGIQAAARNALATLSATTHGAGAALLVTTADGVHVLSAGDSTVFSSPAADGLVEDIVAIATALRRYSVTVAVRRVDGSSFTARDRRLLDVSAPLFVTWLSGVIQRSIEADATPALIGAERA